MSGLGIIVPTNFSFPLNSSMESPTEAWFCLNRDSISELYIIHNRKKEFKIVCSATRKKNVKFFARFKREFRVNCMGVNEPWRVMRMAYTSKFAELYKSTHLSYHYLCYLLVSCALGLDFLGLLLYLRIAGYYFAPLLIVGIFALLAITKRKSGLS